MIEKKGLSKQIGSNNFYCAKGIAIISVIIAHLAVVGSNAEAFEKSLLPVFDRLGLFGVPVFFMLSGYFFFENSDRILKFIKKKFLSILIPWITCSTLVFFITSWFGTKNNSINCLNWLNFIIGNGSIYYFLPLLILFYIIFWKARKFTDGIFIIALTLNFISILYYNSFKTSFPYLNPMNWISFFSTGLFLRKYDLINKIINLTKAIFFFLLASLLTVLLYSVEIERNGFAYFKASSFALEYLGIFLILFLSAYLCSDFLVNFVKISFSLYLLHLPAAGLINIECDRLKIILPFKVILALAGFYIAGLFLLKISEKINFIKILIGARNRH